MTFKAKTYWTRHGYPWNDPAHAPGLITVEEDGAGAYDIIARHDPDAGGGFIAILAVRPCHRTAVGYAEALSRVRGVPFDDWSRR